MQTVKFHKKLLLAYTEKEDGNIDTRFGNKSQVNKTRRAIFKSLKLNPYAFIEAQQIHSDRILALNDENTKMWRGQNVTGVDGFITDQTDIALILRVADCVPVVMYDPKNHAQGIFHAGWRGTMNHIHVKGLEMMVNHYDTNPKKVLTWLGPSAHGCCFVSKEKPKQLTDKSWNPYIKKRKNAYKIDLIGYISDTLKKAGALKKNVTVAPECTVDTPELYSHTRYLEKDEPEGRFAVIAKLQ